MTLQANPTSARKLGGRRQRCHLTGQGFSKAVTFFIYIFFAVCSLRTAIEAPCRRLLVKVACGCRLIAEPESLAWNKRKD